MTSWCGCVNGCLPIEVDVPLMSGGTKVDTARMAGTLCVPSGGTPEKLVIMVPGATENQWYFDFPYRPEIYSVPRYMRSRGYSTLVLDRIGTGRSTRPPSPRVDTSTQSVALNHVITAARAGQLGGATFTHITVMGHSLGSAITVAEAATFRDVDAIVVTGYAHLPVEALEPVVSALYASYIPANQSEILPAADYDDGYLTNAPVPAPESEDPNVTEANLGIMDVVSANESASVFHTMIGDLSALIDVPVLLAVGSEDFAFCGELSGHDCSSAEAFKSTEQEHWTANPFDVFILEGAGHLLQHDQSAPQLNKAVADWLDTNTQG